MKPNVQKKRIVQRGFPVVIAAVCGLSLQLQQKILLAQDTAFTYQGRLEREGIPADGLYDFQFTIYDAATGDAAIAGPITNSAVLVRNGFFTSVLDFGPGVFQGEARWLEIGVRTNGSGPFTILSPRQRLTSVPYAITASRLSGLLPATQLSGTVPSANLSGTYSAALVFSNPSNSFSGDGAGLSGLNASQLTSGTVPDARLGANVARTNQFWWVDVRWFGANGTDANDDSVAIQAALNAAKQAGYGTAVYIPAGTYYITTNIVVPWGVNIFGDGSDNHNEQNPRASRIVQTSSSYNGFCFPYIHNQWVRDISLWGPTGAAANVGLSISNANYTANGEQFYAANVGIRGFGFGFYQSGPSSIRLQGCYIYNQNNANILLEGLIDSLSIVNCNIGYNRDTQNKPRYIPGIRINGSGLKSLIVENCEIGDVGPVIVGGGGGTITFVNNNVERHLDSTNMIVLDVNSTLNFFGGRISVGGNTNALVLGKGASAQYNITILAPYPNDWWGHVAPEGTTGALWFETESPNAKLLCNANYGFWRSKSGAAWVYRAASAIHSYALAELPAPNIHSRGRLAVILSPQDAITNNADGIWFYGFFNSTNLAHRKLAFTSGETFGTNTFCTIITASMTATNLIALVQVDSIPWADIPVSTTGVSGKTNWAFINVNGAVCLVMTNTMGNVAIKQLAP